MRIAVNALQVRAAKTGVGQFIYALLDAMTRQAPDDQFSVYCTRENVANYALPVPNLEPRVWGLSQSARSARLLYEYAFLPGLLRRQGFDLFHGASNFLPPRKVCPYVVSIYDLSYYVHPHRCPPVRRRYWYAMTSRTIAVADAIITVSENSRRDIERYFPAAAGRISVIPGAAHSRFRPLSYGREQSAVARPEFGLGDRRYLLYVGTLEPGKNVERLIHAFSSVAAEFPDCQLALVGDKGWLYETIFAAAAASPHRERIRFLGHLPDADVVELFNFCEAFVYPSLYEGFGLPPLEAMACGAPVVTSTSSSIPEVVGDAAIMVDPTSTEGLAEALRQVLSDPGLRTEMRERGLARSALFSWENTARQTLEIYRKTAAAG